MSSFLRPGVWFLLISACAGFPLLAQSQATTGVLEGWVSGPNEAAVAGSTVTILHLDTNSTRTTTTDERGRFRAVLLPLGHYRISASAQGFRSASVEGIRLSVGQTLSVRLPLGLEAVAEEIVVSADPLPIEISRTDNSVMVGKETLDSIPNNGRNFLEMSKLTPGVAIVQGPDGDELTINGQKGIQNNVSVDGADFNNPFFGEQRGGQRPAFTFNLDAVEELVVVADGAPAEFGRSSGGFVNVVTKSGTNSSRGTAHLFFQDDSLGTSARRPDGSREPEADLEQLQTGFTLGGPLRRDELFYFVAFDHQSGETLKQKDPNRIEPRVVNALAALGSPEENGPIERTDDATVFLGKLDWQIGDANLFTFRATSTDAEQANGTFDVDSWGRSANAVEKVSSYSFSTSLVSTVSSNTLNELRAQYAKEERPRPYDGPTILGTDRPLPDIAFDFANEYRFGMPFFIPVAYDDQRWQANDNITFLRGAHTVKAGIEFNTTSAFQTFVGFANGRFIFSSTEGFLEYSENPDYVECSDGSSSPDGTCPEGTSITGPVLLYLQQAGVGDISVEEAGTQTITQKEPAVFIQDTWQPSANLTVSAGLRWEASLQPDPITPADEVFYADFIGTTSNGQEFPSDGTIPDDTDNFQPRLGISWDPWSDGKTVVRANAGRYNARVPGLVLASSRSTNGSRGQTLFRNSTLTGILGAPPPITELIPQDEVGSPFRPDVFVFDKDFEVPETDTFALSVERELRTGIVGLLKFNYSETKNLTRFVNRNDPLLGPGDGTGPWSSGLDGGPNGIGALTVVESSASSRYRGLTLGVTGRTRALDFQAFYTYSKDRSNDDNERDPFSFRYARITDLDAEWGDSDRDQRDRFNAWLLWRAPGGLHVNARYTYRSAQPVSLTENGTVAATPQDRINADGTVTQRNLGRKDNEFSSLDLRISKTLDVGPLEIEVIGEVFNLFNEENFRKPESTSLVFNFDGTVTSGLGDPRQGQIGVRVRW